MERFSHNQLNLSASQIQHNRCMKIKENSLPQYRSSDLYSFIAEITHKDNNGGRLPEHKATIKNPIGNRCYIRRITCFSQTECIKSISGLI